MCIFPHLFLLLPLRCKIKREVKNMEYQFIISGPIGVAYDWWSGQRGTTAKEVRDFLNANKDKDVDIAVSSPGGYVDAGLEIYQYVKDHGKVHMHIIGMTASAATFLTMGAASVDMVDGSLMLIHNASTSVMEWQSANKKQLDAIIAKYQKERDDLDTIDKVIASLYARKCGKPLKDCLDKMDYAAWLSPQDALDFGLIDEIRDVDDKKKKCNSICKSFTNIVKDYGLPPLPEDFGMGAPTHGSLQKSVQKLWDRFRNKTAQKQHNMIKIFVNVMALLAITDGFKTDDEGNVALTQEQLKKVDDRLGSLNDELKSITDERDNAIKEKKEIDEQLKKVQDELAASNKQIENLKAAPGVDDEGKAGTQTPADGETESHNRAVELFNSVKDL